MNWVSPDALEQCDNCSNMRRPVGLTGGLCETCRLQQRGWKCDSCGSPWVYLLVSQPPTWCKPCAYAMLEREGYFDDVDKIIEQMNADHKKAAEKRRVELAKAQEEFEPPVQRKYKKKQVADGGLFNED